MFGISPLLCQEEDNQIMQTQLLEANELNILEAARLLRDGEVVAFPTETVYGLGANALNAQAVQGIFHCQAAPGRQSADHPHCSDIAGSRFMLLD